MQTFKYSNRTFMELKSDQFTDDTDYPLLQSHLYGIEIEKDRGFQILLDWLQSHLYGIEIKQP